MIGFYCPTPYCENTAPNDYCFNGRMTIKLTGVLTLVVPELVEFNAGNVTRTHRHQKQGKFIDT